MISNSLRLFTSRVSRIRNVRSFTTVPDTDFVLTEEVGDKGVIIFNRSQALNAKTYEMVHKIQTHLHKWKDTKSMILVKSNCEKAFCVGGDIKAISVASNPSEFGKSLFRTEYTVNHMIGSLKIPYVALINGFTMGGGVGVSVHGKYRIATEKTVVAMPEAAVGLIPDAGCSYVFPRLQGRLGFYLALTGFQLKGQDVLHAGIATHYCDSTKIPQIEKTLLALENVNDIAGVINDFCPTPKTEFSLSKHLDKINQAFNSSSMEEIISNLEKDGSEWAKQTVKILRSKSPTSLKLTLRLYELGAKMSLGECLQMEYRVNLRCMQENDFKEGVRALLVTKSNDPKFKPSQIEDVSEQRVISFFQPLPNNEDLPIDVKLSSEL